ncbi:MAG: 50S ribosomal protein L17 [Acidobacteria bacterium]|nr:50S ribosomal protein L17 [Acidobacteriota bacterium]
MRHRVANRKLGRVTEHRIALLRSLSRDLLRHEHLETTVPKAKELRPFVEHLITVAKRGLAAGSAPVRVLNARRLVLRDIHDELVVTKLFDVLAPRFAERPGGYTRLLRIGHRRGDSADLALVELVGSEFNPKATADKAAKNKVDKPKAKGMGGRLRAAAERIRGKKAAGQSEDAAATDAEVKSQARAAARKGSGGSRRAPGGRGPKGK